MISKFKSKSCDLNVDYASQKQATNRIFTFMKIEEFTSEKSDDSKNNLSSNLSEKLNSSTSDQNRKLEISWKLY